MRAALVRATLVIAIITTYWQIFWHKLRQDLPFVTIDSLASLPTTPYEFLSLRTLRASPLLVALAALSWLIPVAVVFTPGTLTVVPWTHTDMQLQAYAALNFSHMEAFAFYGKRYHNGGLKRNMGPSGNLIQWDGPSIELRRSAMRVAYASELPFFSSLQPNTSYSLAFYGPAVQCREARVVETLRNLSIAAGNCSDSNTWLANCPAPDRTDRASISYYYLAGVIGASSTHSDSSTPISLHETLGFNEAQVASILIAHRDSLQSHSWGVLNCSLHNASYTVSFDFLGQHQIVQVTEREMLELVRRDTLPLRGSGMGGPLERSTNDAKSYFAAMQMLGEVLVGALWHNYGSTWSGMMPGPPMNQTRDTIILQTTLALTTEMFPLYKLYTSSPATINKTTRPSLASAIEELFQNMTLAMFNVPSLLTDEVFETEMEKREYFNVYRYNRGRLALAYGVAIALTAQAVAVGAYTIAHTGKSYSNKFSTTVRISRSEKLALLIAAEDRQGEDPLPRHIAKAEVRFIEDGDHNDLGSNERTALRA